jgi:hypothetical protein
MSEYEYRNADYEVIRMVNRGHGPGGELPSVALSFIPKDRADRVAALDHRIQQLRAATPYLMIGACLMCLLLGKAM